MNYLYYALLIPFLGTAIGSGMVFFLKNDLHPRIQKTLLGFASGVMVAASVWSLLLPSISMSESQGFIEWVPAAVGFIIGILFLLGLDILIPHLHANSDDPEGLKSSWKKSTMLVLAVTLHNIPEGMALGVVFAGLLSGSEYMSSAGVLTLAIGLAIQNSPEGAIISMPLRTTGMSKLRAFVYGALSGIVEPIAAVLTILLTSLFVPVLPYLLSFAAGAMFYVVVEELIPNLQEGRHSNCGILGFAGGFVLMMVLDIALG